jgi:hypothetical protein
VVQRLTGDQWVPAKISVNRENDRLRAGAGYSSFYIGCRQTPIVLALKIGKSLKKLLAWMVLPAEFSLG